MKINETIIKLREEKGWSQRELAEKIGINKAVMNRIELGDRSVRAEELERIANIFGVSSDYLLGLPEMDDEDQRAFNQFLHDPALHEMIKELSVSDADKLDQLRKMWDIIKNN